MISASTLQSSVTRPAQLLYLESPWNLRLCNRMTINDGSYTWEKAGFATRLTKDVKGKAALDISLANDGFAYTNTLLSITDPFDLTLWSLYRVGDNGFETQQRFYGSCTSIQENTSVKGSEIRMVCSPVGSRFRYSPRVLWDNAEAIGRGSKVVIGGTTYVFE